MQKKTLLFIFSFFYCMCLSAITYDFTNDPIDVIIPATEKDLPTLDLCIRGIRKNCSQIRRIIVISDNLLTTQAEWFDEKKFPFSREDVAYYLLECNEEKAKEYLSSSKRVGWYLQQLLKLYAMYVIPNLSSNILILDSDTLFFNSVNFTQDSGSGLYSTGTEYYKPYFDHMKRFVPGLDRLFPKYSGICHHMLFQKSVLDDLFQVVESYHGKELWKAFCLCVNKDYLYGSGASEYEIYFNFLFSRSNQAKIRVFNWKNVGSLKEIGFYKKRGFDYVSCHNYLRTENGRNGSAFIGF